MKYSYWNELQRYNQQKKRDANRAASMKIFTVCFVVLAAYSVAAFVQVLAAYLVAAFVQVVMA